MADRVSGGVSQQSEATSAIASTLEAIARCLGRHKRFAYTYDFGDGWEHRLVVEKTLPPDRLPHPVCVDGENACPPEDVGGPPGYAAFLEAVADPEHPEHEEYLAWCGGQIDPAAFDLVATNRRLSRIKR